MITGSEFKSRVEDFLKERNMPATRFGIDAMKDPGFVFRLRSGRVPSIDTVNRVVKFMDGAKQ